MNREFQWLPVRDDLSQDAAETFPAMAERGHAGEIYNVANGACRPLREFVEEMRQLIAPGVDVCYGAPSPDTFWLQPSVDKLQKDTGWLAKVSFAEGVRDACGL